MNDEDLQPKKLRRNSDPSTSHAAAIGAFDFLANHHRKVLAGLSLIGEGTFYEIAEATDLEPPAVWRRMNELQKRGLVEVTGGERNGPTGRRCRIWRISRLPPAICVTVKPPSMTPVASNQQLSLL